MLVGAYVECSAALASGSRTLGPAAVLNSIAKLLSMAGLNLGVVLAVLVGGGGLGLWAWTGRRRRLGSGLLLGIAAIFTQFVPYEVIPGVLIDGRPAIVAFAGLFFGASSAVIAGAMALAVRAFIGGPGLSSAVFVVVVSAIMGSAFGRKASPLKWKVADFALFGIGLMLIGAAGGLLLPSRPRSHVLSQMPLLVGTFALVSTLLGILIRDEVRRALDHMALSYREARYRALVHAQPDLLLVLDDVGRYVEIEGLQSKHLPRSRDALLGRTMHDILPKEPADRLLEVVRGVLKEGAVRSFSYEMEVPAGLRQFEARVTPLPEQAEARPSVLWIARDVTDRARLEHRLRQSAKMESIGRLAGGVAHDFNNLLMVIRGHSGLLLESEISPETRHDIEEIDEAAARAATMTSQLMAIGRQQVLEPRQLRPDETIRGSAGLLGRLMGEDISLALVLTAPKLAVLIDPGQFNQILLNLTTNARDAMPNGGSFRIHTRAVQETASADGAEEPAQWNLYIEASDTGQGMSKEVAESIFEPFFTTKAEQGNGLGLATVASIVAQAEGQIKVLSELNAGTTFTICLPAIWVEPIEEEPPQPAPRIEASRDAAATILVAEDELAIQALMSRILERAGYTVLMGSSAEEAIEMSDAHEGHIDLLLTDVVMTGMNGRELADTMQVRRPGVAVLFMSGFDGGALRQRGIHEGERFLAKPFSRQKLLDAVEASLAVR